MDQRLPRWEENKDSDKIQNITVEGDNLQSTTGISADMNIGFSVRK